MDGSVNVYDSIYTSIDATTEGVLTNLFHSHNIKLQPLQKQIGATDCGLFAIAVITAIAHGKDPSQLQFRQEEMRSHLLSCFKNKIITPFQCK